MGINVKKGIDLVDTLQFFFNISLSLLLLFNDSDFSRSYSYIYFGIFCIANLITLILRRGILSVFYPGSLLVFYVCFSCYLGSWAYSNDLVLEKYILNIWYELRYLNIASFFLIFASSIILLTQSFFIVPIRLNSIQTSRHKTVNWNLFFCYLLVCSGAYFIFQDLSFLGGSGDFSKITIAVPLIFILIQSIYLKRLDTQLLLGTVTIILMALISVEDKRDAIFLALPFFLVLLLSGKIKSLWTLLPILLFLVPLGIILILAMSVSRGYGGMEITNVIDILPALQNYISSDFFLAAFFLNIEVNYLYFHAVSAIELISMNPELIAYGSTIAKVLFLAVPRSIFPNKPSSMIDEYTSAFDPVFREVGGSYPVNLIVESFWNFSYFGVLFLVILTIILSVYHNSVYKKNFLSDRIYCYCYMFIFYNLLVYFRGSGLDMFLVFCILGIACIYMSHLLHSILFKK